MKNIFYLLAVIIMASCATPKVIEQHHHHSASADTMAIKAMVDSRVNSWHERIDSTIHQSLEKARTEWFSHEDEKEKTTETITTWVDSLGRQMRQEQRTTERSLSREQQQREERLSQQFEMRLQAEMDRQDSIWQARLDKLQAHWDQKDSTEVKETPVPADNRPWYKRWWDNLRFILLGAGIIVVLYVTRRFWRK